jgi:hypothetical protein
LEERVRKLMLSGVDKAKNDLIHKKESMAVIVIKYIDGQY